MTDYILGIDGGGTSCRAAVARPDGIILGRGKSGAANILTDPNNAIISITEAAKAAYRDAGLDEAGVSGASAFLGLAGTNVGDLTRYVHDRLPFRHTDIDSDGLIGKLTTLHAAKPQTRVVLKADVKLAYGKVRAMFKRCQEIGFPGASLQVIDRANKKG